jgi:pimeloyl-ACP methyl ester carboxylesterase
VAAERTAAKLTEQPQAHVLLRGEGDPVLFLHGWGTSSSLFEPLLQPLQRDHTLIVPDLPGFGETAPPAAAWGVNDYAAWTLALLDRLDIERCDIVAHSNGARIAIVIAANSPQRVHRMVLTGAAGLRHRRGPLAWLGVRWYKMLRRMSSARVAPAALRRYAESRAQRRGSEDYRAATGVMRGTLVRLVNTDLRSLLPRIAAPTLLVWGDSDDATPLADARVMEKLIPDCGLVVFERSGHYAYLQQAQRFVRIVDVFLSGQG